MSRSKQVAVVIAFLVLYLGTYYAVVGREQTRHNVRGVVVSSETKPLYSMDEQSDRRWATVFAPAHRLDRLIRRSFWNPAPGE